MPPGLFPPLLQHLLGNRSSNLLNPFATNPFAEVDTGIEEEGDGERRADHRGGRWDGHDPLGRGQGIDPALGQASTDVNGPFPSPNAPVGDGGEPLNPAIPLSSTTSPSNFPTPPNTGTETLDLPLAQLASLGNAIKGLGQALDARLAQPFQATPPPFKTGGNERAISPLSSTAANQPSIAQAAQPSTLSTSVANSAAAIAPGNVAAASAGAVGVASTSLPAATQYLQQTTHTQTLERTLFLQSQLAPATRTADATMISQTLRNDAVPLADRIAMMQQAPLQQPAAPQIPGRPDVAPMMLSQLPSAPMIVNAPIQVIGNTQANAPLSGNNRVGTTAHEGVVGPAGHTIEGAQRRRFGQQQRQLPKSAAWLNALIDRRSKSRRENLHGDPAATSIQWLFWILSIIAYAAFAMAITMLIPEGSSDVFNEAGRPSVGGLALMTGLATAVVAWGLARYHAARGRARK